MSLTLWIITLFLIVTLWASQVALVVKNPPDNAGDIREMGSILGSERTPGGRDWHPFQYSCLKNHMDRGVWLAMVHGVAKSWTWMKQFSMHSHILWLYRVNTSVIFNHYRWDLFPINLLLFCRFSVNFQLTEMWKLNIKLFF